MTRALPDACYVTEDVWPVSSENDLRSATGANRQKIARKGSHYRASFACQPLDPNDARPWRRLHSEGQTVVAQIEQPGIEIGAPGSPRVNGAGQAGASLILDGLTPHYVIEEGQLLVHISASGERRLYMASETVIADADGEATVPLYTMLTAPPADNDVVTLTDITIEGFATVEDGSFLTDGDGYMNIRFSVEEPG